MALPDTAKVVPELPRALRPVLAPLVKMSLGISVGVVASVLFFVVAMYHGLWDPDGEMTLWVHLLGQNGLVGYAPTVGGAFIGIAWGFVVGFAFGWLMAAGRNVVVSIYVFLVGAKERMRASGDFLDQIM